jgi:hypothetical protein
MLMRNDAVAQIILLISLYLIVVLSCADPGHRIFTCTVYLV